MDLSDLDAVQFANVVYALLVRDAAAQVDRTRLDEVLSGAIPSPQLGPALDTFNPELSDEALRRQQEALRDSWGSSPEAIQGQRATEEFIKQVRPGGMIIRKEK